MRAIHRAFVVACCAALAACGCRATSSPGVVAAAQGNERSVAAAKARAGLVDVPLQESSALFGGPRLPRVTTATLVTSPAGFPAGARLVVFPQGAAPVVVRDRAGELHELTVRHEVVGSRGDRRCGCGPVSGGGAPPPPPPVPFVELGPKETWGAPLTIVARGWIDVDDTYPHASDRGCFEIP